MLSSRLDEKKNLTGAVEAYAFSKELQDKANLALFIRGVNDLCSDLSCLQDKERDILEPIVKLIEEQNIRDKVFCFNIGSQGELAAAYRYFAGLGSVFALTAFYEPFGLAPIEAAACGLAVVATKNGGPSEIFKARRLRSTRRPLRRPKHRRRTIGGDRKIRRAFRVGARTR